MKHIFTLQDVKPRIIDTDVSFLFQGTKLMLLIVYSHIMTAPMNFSYNMLIHQSTK